MQAQFLEMRKAPLSSAWGRQRCLKMSPWSCPWKYRMERRDDYQGRELRAHRRGLSTGREEDMLLRVHRNQRRSQARGSGEVLGHPVATCSDGKPQTKALLCGHLRTTDIDFWLSLVSTSFKTFSKLHEGFVVLLVEMHLESGNSVCGNAGHGGRTKLYGPAWAPSKTSSPAPRSLDH